MLWCNRMLRREAINRSMTYSQIENSIGKRYFEFFGRKLDWENPKTYTEKINVSKVYNPTPLKTRLADKILVRDWIREKIGEEYLIPLIGVYDSFDEIDFSKLPEQFVMKCNHDSGSYTICTDKSKLNMKFLKLKYDKHLKRNFAYMGFEMHYREITPKIIIEKYMGENINDYKFLCFNGKPYFCWVDVDRRTNHRRNFYDMNWQLQPFSFSYENYSGVIQCPKNFDKMQKLALELSSDFDHTRADFYLVNGNIYFGEMTFTSENGFGVFSPDEWDYKLGELWQFDNSNREKVNRNSKP